MSPAAVPSTSAKVSSALALARRAEDEEVRPYVIVSDLGKGSFATVYKGYHEVRLLVLDDKGLWGAYAVCVGDEEGGGDQDC